LPFTFGMFLPGLLHSCCVLLSNYKYHINTLAAGLIQAVRKKQLIRTWVCGWISLLLFALATRRISQKTLAV